MLSAPGRQRHLWASHLRKTVAMTARAPRRGIEPTERMTAADLERLVAGMVDIWVGEMVRDGEIHPDAAPSEIDEFKLVTTTTILTLFTSVEGLEGHLLAGTRAPLPVLSRGFFGLFPKLLRFSPVGR